MIWQNHCRCVARRQKKGSTMKRLHHVIALAVVFTCALESCSADAGAVAESDAGADAESDAGVDAESDAGADAGAEFPVLFIDTDMGLDDARVIVSLPMQSTFRVVGITTVEGAAGAAKGADNALRLLAALGVDSIPVAVGSTVTLAGEEIPAPPWRVMAEGLGGMDLDAATRAVEDEGGVAFERRVLRESATMVHMLVIGPATNLALALAEEPELADKIASVYLLGDFSACSGYNCTTDQDAGAAIRESGVSIYMLMPAETNQIPFDADFLASVQALDGPAAVLIAGFMAGHSSGVMKLWDDAVLASMLDADVITYGAVSGALRASDAIDVEAVEAMLLGLWDTPSPVMPSGYD